MSNHEFENYLALVSRLMRLNSSQTSLIRDEMRDHLETRVTELVESGVDNNDAMRQALEEFGDAAVLANRFQAVSQLNQRRWMMRFATFSIVGTFLAAVLLMAMWPSPAHFGSPSSGIAQEDALANNDGQDALEADQITSVSTSARPDQEKRKRVKIATSEDIDKKLQQRCSFDYHETSFLEVMNHLRDEYEMNVVLDHTARDDSLTEDEIVTMRVNNIGLSTALRLMLKDKNATYLVDDGILRIISLDSAGDPEFFRRKIFDCRSLLEKITRTDKRVGTPVRIEWLHGRREGGGFGGGGNRLGGGVFNIGPSRNSNQDSEPAARVQTTSNSKDATSADESPNEIQQQPAGQAANQAIVQNVTADAILEKVIKKSIDSDGWHDSNGDGTLMTVSGFMVVNQTQETLDEIEKLIAELDRRIR